MTTAMTMIPDYRVTAMLNWFEQTQRRLRQWVAAKVLGVACAIEGAGGSRDSEGREDVPALFVARPRPIPQEHAEHLARQVARAEYELRQGRAGKA